MKNSDIYFNILLEIKRSHKNTKEKKAAKLRKVEKKVRSLRKGGGNVRGVHISSDAMKHLSTRKEGSQTTEDPGITAFRQVKIAAPEHKKGQPVVNADHGKNVGHELVKPRSEIPKKDIEKETTVQKPQGAGHVDVTKVSTNRPIKDYETSKAFSVAVPKNPDYMSDRDKTRKVGGRRRPLKGRRLKKALKGPTLVTSAPGRSAPPVSDWGRTGHVVVEPKKKMDGRESMKNSDVYFHIGQIFLETRGESSIVAAPKPRKARSRLDWTYRRPEKKKVGSNKKRLPPSGPHDGTPEVATGKGEQII